MQTKNCLTAEQEDTLREIYREDVSLWSWSHWISLYKKFGEGPMGLVWVILPAKPDPVMPLLRRRLNEIYYACLAEHADQKYGLGVRFDQANSKLILCAKESATPL